MQQNRRNINLLNQQSGYKKDLNNSYDHNISQEKNHSYDPGNYPVKKHHEGSQWVNYIDYLIFRQNHIC